MHSNQTHAKEYSMQILYTHIKGITESVWACLRFISLGPTTIKTVRVGPKLVLKGEKTSRNSATHIN